MRGIWLADATGQRFEGPMAHGLPTEVWRVLYDRIMHDSALPLLQRIWRDQWGPEGDVYIAPEELPALQGELTAVLPSAPEGEEQDVLDRLLALTHEAKAQGAGLIFFAD